MRCATTHINNVAAAVIADFFFSLRVCCHTIDELKVHNDTSRFAIGLSCLSTIGLFTLLSIVSVLSDPHMEKSLIILRLVFLALVFVALLALQFVWQHYLQAAAKGTLVGTLHAPHTHPRATLNRCVQLSSGSSLTAFLFLLFFVFFFSLLCSYVYCKLSRPI